tara:strand:+ start:13 stop:762 length:750 start_codon:yes stop_codon:yes gene_type:complete
MSVKDNEKVYFGDEKVPKELKKDGVEGIFTKVSENYDLMNDLMSLGMHRIWKNIFVDSANIKEDQIILDLAAGTGDIAKKIAQKVSDKTIYICDQNNQMVEKAKERSLNEGFYNKCNFDVSSAEKLPYKDDFFDQVFISFGFRNFSDKEKGLKEIRRVLKVGGTFQILEFSKTEGDIFSRIYDAYNFNIIPKLGELISNDKESYEYLVKSIKTHESQEQILTMMKECGFLNTSYKNLFKGVVAIHKGNK